MLRLHNISKYFSGVKALQQVSLEFKAGEVHALCGENGAGKTTLMNIIMGNTQPDEGSIYWKNEPVSIPNVVAAQRLDISIVYQQRSLADSLSIAENIHPVHLPLTKSGLIDYPTLYKKTQSLLNDLGLANLSPKTSVSKLSVAQQQMVEIAKAIAQHPQLLILDEPTASITHSETAILFRIIQQLKANDIGVIYISHRMAEIQEIADTISVLKDGKFVGTVPGNTPSQQIIRMMVGREMEQVSETSHAREEIQLDVQNISGKGFKDISFQLYKGEILGFAGLQGAGRTAMAKALFGESPVMEGTVVKDNILLKITHPSDAIYQQIAYIPEERKTEGLFLEKSIADNIFSAQLTKGWYNEDRVNKASKALCDQLGVRTPNVRQQARKLSGGNQQKVVLAKWLALQPEILIVNEPTHGVDVGAKAEIYALLKTLTAEGKSIVLISSELPELLLICDRIAVMHEGRIKAILDRSDATEEKIAALASGIDH